MAAVADFELGRRLLPGRAALLSNPERTNGRCESMAQGDLTKYQGEGMEDSPGGTVVNERVLCSVIEGDKIRRLHSDQILNQGKPY